jgi:multiple sugar transport system substrate-binding protein
MTRLRGIGWDHERCRAPMQAAAARWHQLHGGSIDWDFRPLASFNDQPVAELAHAYDVLVIDHPYVGEAAATRSLVPLDELLDAQTLRALADDAVGPGHASYHYGGHQWALATDAACHVSAIRDDLLVAPPRTWEDVLALARDQPGRVALPLYPTDAICSLLTLCAAHGAPFGQETGVDEEAVAFLLDLVPHLHPQSLGFNPPRAFDRMSGTDEIAFVPLAFGYTTYSRIDRPGRRLRFLDLPTRGSLLGGAGLAVSSAAADPAAAARFVAWVAAPEQQRDIVFAAGGQPGSRAVWTDPAADAAAGGFFSGTIATMEAAHVRSREPWWPPFQLRAGELLAASLRERRPAAAIARALRALLPPGRPPTAAIGWPGD